MSKIKAIIFDCFGVLTTDSWQSFRDEFCDTDEQFYQAKLLDNAANNKSISYDTLIEELAKLVNVDRARIAELFNSRNNANLKLFEYIRDELKPKFSIGMLSNAAENWLNEMFEDWQVALFDSVVLSCDLGVVKPAPGMYQAICDKLGLSPDECVFIDDVEAYCRVAEDLGMKSVVYTGFEDLKTRLSEIIEQS